MVDPFVDYINDSHNPAFLRNAAVPLAAVSGAAGAVGGAAVGAVQGTVEGIGSFFRSIFGN
jgi:hypothetical protein